MRSAFTGTIVTAINALLPIYSHCQETQTPVKYLDRVSFYADTQDGVIALAPSSNREGDAKYATAFWAFEKDKCYELARKANYGFVANITDKTGERTTPSFLAITVIQAQKPDSDAGAGIELTRNDNWTRDKNSIFKPDPRELRAEQVDFSDIQGWNGLSSIAAFDAELQKKIGRDFYWHGIPVGGDVSSWDFRDSLFGGLTHTKAFDFLRHRFTDLSPTCTIRVTMHLLRFTPARKRVPNKIMDFYVNDCEGSCAAIISKCPDYPSYDNLVWLKIK